MQNQNFKYFIYCRKSNGNEKDSSPSIDSQYKELSTYAERNKLKIVGIFKEVQSAFELGRPKFAEMIERIKDGEANGILIWEISRLSRNMQDSSTIDNLLRSKRLLKIQTPSRDYVDSDGEDFMLAMELVISRQYSKEISKRVKRGIRFKISGLEWPCSAPLGYLNVSKNRTMTGYMTDEKRNIEKLLLEKCSKEKRELKRVEVNPLQGPLVSEAFKKFSSGNYSIVSLIDEMEERGLKNKFGGRVSKNCMFHALRNPFYYGVMRFNNELHESNHEPLISKRVFDEVQEVLKIKSKPLRRRRKFEFSGGMIKCGNCGCSITALKKMRALKGGGANRHVYYTCTRMRDKVRRIPCDQEPIKEVDLKKQLEVQVKRIRLNEVTKKVLIEAIKMSHEKEKEMHQQGLAQWQNMYSSAENKLNKLFDLFYSGNISQSEFSERKGVILQDKERAKEHLEMHGKAQESWLNYSEKLIITTDHVYEIFKNGTIEEVKDLMLMIGKNYTLKNGIATFQFKEPYNYLVELSESRGSNNEDMRGRGDLNP